MGHSDGCFPRCCRGGPCARVPHTPPTSLHTRPLHTHEWPHGLVLPTLVALSLVLLCGRRRASQSDPHTCTVAFGRLGHVWRTRCPWVSLLEQFEKQLNQWPPCGTLKQKDLKPSYFMVSMYFLSARASLGCVDPGVTSGCHFNPLPKPFLCC